MIQRYERCTTEFVRIGATPDDDVVVDRTEKLCDLAAEKAAALAYFRLAQSPKWKGPVITGFQIKNAKGEVVLRRTWWDEKEHQEQKAQEAAKKAG